MSIVFNLVFTWAWSSTWLVFTDIALDLLVGVGEQTHFCTPFPTLSPASSTADSVFYSAGLHLLWSSPEVIDVVCQQFTVLLPTILCICLCVGLEADTFLLSLPSSVAYLSSGWQLLRTSPGLAFHPYWSAQALVGS